MTSGAACALLKAVPDGIGQSATGAILFAPGRAAWHSFLTQVRDTGVPIRNTDFGAAT